jgi:TonB-dependent SusC/RagA subfamily outer membrane receptor
MHTSDIRARRAGVVLLATALSAASAALAQGAHAQTGEAHAAQGQAVADSAQPQHLADSVPATGGRLPRLQVGAYVGTIRADSVVPTAPIFQFTDLLTARLPGVDVQSGGGMSGSGARVIIRGTGSTVDGSDPVVYLDGIRIASDPSRPATGGGTDFAGQADFVGALGMSRLDDLSPNEIQRVDVLSGPAATTQYGLDAWNGVILVTTRRPASQTPQWSAFFEEGAVSTQSSPLAANYLGWGHEPNGTETSACTISAQLAGQCVLDSITHFSPLDNGTTSPLTTGNRDRFGLQVGGGAGPGRYFLSGERQSEMGILEMPGPEVQLFTQTYGHLPDAGQVHPNSLDRTNLRATAGAQLGDHADISFFGNSIGGVHRSVGDAALSEDVAAAPGMAGVGGGYSGSLRPSNTFATEGADRVERYIYGGSATWRPSSVLSAQLTTGADRANTHAESYTPQASATPTEYTEATEHEVTTEYTGDANITADVPVAHGWSSRTSGGVQYREQRQANVYFEAPTPIGSQFPDTIGGAFNAFETHNDGIQRSAYLEETAAWGNRLAATAALRAEGPRGLFGAGTLGYPRIALSWSPWIRGDDVVRLHAAYGVTGDLPVTQVYNLQENITAFLNPLSSQLFGGTPRIEQIAEYEGGADVTILHERLSAGFSVYDRTINQMPIVFTSAEDGILFNRFRPTGIVRNRGAEVTLSAQIVRNEELTWSANFNGWTNANRVITIGSDRVPEFINFWYRVQAGHTIYSIWEPTLSYHDANGDGIIEPNEVTIGHPTDHGSAVPTRGASLQNSFAFLRGRFRVGALVDYKGGNKLIDEILADQLFLGQTRGNADPHAPLLEQAQQVAAAEGGGNLGSFIGPAEDASFVRFRELSLTVNFGTGIAHALRTRSVALSLLARNLWLWTPYRGADPEVNIAANGDPVGTETVLPQPRYFVARVTLGY